MATTRERIEGVYEQAQPERYMVRVKVHGTRLCAPEANALSELADAHGGAMLHLTTRMSVEFHGLDDAGVEAVFAGLALVVGWIVWWRRRRNARAPD